MNDTVLLTGGAGFAGSHILRHLHQNTDWDIVVLDRLSYAGTLERIAEYRGDPRVKFVYHDFRAALPAPVLHKLADVRYVIHNGGETHVANSLLDPELFVQSNVLGTLHILDAARTLSVDHLIFVSTDEVHGPAPEGVDFTESAAIAPSNPYSASKAGAEALAFAYWKSYALPVTITRTMNLYGERQHPEKFIPMTIRKVLKGERVVIHGTKGGQVGSRKWLHARNQADALLFLLRVRLARLPSGVYRKGQVFEPVFVPPSGETFHIAGEEHSNLDMALRISHILERPLHYDIVDFHATHPGHDLRYSLDDAKIRALGWSPPVSFEDSLVKMVKWTVRPENAMWLGA